MDLYTAVALKNVIIIIIIIMGMCAPDRMELLLEKEKERVR